MSDKKEESGSFPVVATAAIESGYLRLVLERHNGSRTEYLVPSQVLDQYRVATFYPVKDLELSPQLTTGGYPSGSLRNLPQALPLVSISLPIREPWWVQWFRERQILKKTLKRKRAAPSTPSR